MEVIIHLTPEQIEQHARLILGIGDGYEEVARRLVERDDLESYEELDQRFAAAANYFEKAAIVQEFQKRVGY